MSAVRVESVVRRHGEVAALDGLTLDVADGELLTVVGPSGSGKSTLLRVLAGLDPVAGGRVLIDGSDVTEAEPAQRGIALMFQSFALFPHLDVAANIAFGLEARRIPAAQRATLVAETAERLEVGGLLARRPSQLSGGERQRVALARALVARPRVLLLDEPLSSLDAQLRLAARAELHRLHAELGTTTIHVTHDQAEALSLGDRVAILRAGRLEQHGTPDEVYARPASAWVARFLGSPPMNVLAGAVADGAVQAGGLRLPLPTALPAGQRVQAGVRPEGLRVGNGASSGTASLEIDERVGHERLWHLRTDGGERVVARVPAGVTGAAGDRVGLSVAARDVQLFDADSGVAL